MPGRDDMRPDYTAADSPVESARFGRRVRRYELTGQDASSMLAELRAERPDLAIVRIPTSRGELVTELCQLGAQFVLGDCRVIYTRDNIQCGLTRGSRAPGFTLRDAARSELDLLDSMVERIFVDYHTHYISNPALAAIPLTDGYKEWVHGFVESPDPSRRCLVAMIDAEPCAFTTMSVTPASGEVVLNGVLPAFRGRGVYRDLLRGTIDEFVRTGCLSTVIATQIDNRQVQRVWVTEGFRLDVSQYTIHLNFRT